MSRMAPKGSAVGTQILSLCSGTVGLYEVGLVPGIFIRMKLFSAKMMGLAGAEHRDRSNGARAFEFAESPIQIYLKRISE